MSKSKVYDRREREARWRVMAKLPPPVADGYIAVGCYAGVWYYRDEAGQYYRTHRRDPRGVSEVRSRDLPDALK